LKISEVFFISSWVFSQNLSWISIYDDFVGSFFDVISSPITYQRGRSVLFALWTAKHPPLEMTRAWISSTAVDAWKIGGGVVGL